MGLSYGLLRPKMSIYTSTHESLLMLRATKVICGSYIHMNFYSTVLAPAPLLWWLNEETEAFEYSGLARQCNCPNSQISWRTCHIFHNAPFRTEICTTFLFWEWCIVGYVIGASWDLWDWSVYCCWCRVARTSAVMTIHAGQNNACRPQGRISTTCAISSLK